MSRRYVNNWPTSTEVLDRAIAELDERAAKRIPQALALVAFDCGGWPTQTTERSAWDVTSTSTPSTA